MRHRLHLFWLRLRGHRYRLLLWLFPRLRDHEKNLNTIEQLNLENRRYVAEIAVLKGQVEEARKEAQTSAIAAARSLDRASQLTLVNDQLQVQLSATMREMADRLERAYGAVTNHFMLGGMSSKRPMYPWIPSADAPPMAAQNVHGPMGKTSLRGQANASTKEFLNKLGTDDPKMRAAAIEAVQARLDSGQWEINANGELVPIEVLATQ